MTSNKEVKYLVGTGSLNSVILISYFATSTITSFAQGSNLFGAIGVLATLFTAHDAYRMFQAWRKL